jgi:glycosyltransferase involved in cell wall biosynthesis
MKVAILHPWFFLRGGSENVVDVLAEIYPEADIYTLFLEPKILSPQLRHRKINSSILNSIPFSAQLYRHLLFLYPLAVESFDLREYDVIISSCGPAMMGCSVRQDAVHICYFHTPQRSWWDLYLDHQKQLPPIARQLFVFFASYIRTWEFCATQRADYVVSNSRYIANRVFKYLHRHSTVIYPPVNVRPNLLGRQKGDYYLTVGRLESPKRVDLLIGACNQLGRQLLIAGTGKEERYLRSVAGDTVKILGYVPDSELPGLYANCRAFLFAADEDFGIAPVEAQSYGRPVVAYGHGGSLETVRVNDPTGLPNTGLFFQHQTITSVVNAIQRFESIETQFEPEQIQQHAFQFGTLRFIDSIKALVDDAVRKKQQGSGL